ncbi:MAG TPA: hypothetical protein PLX06_09455, partial [Fimbriimonadaceae bacterium]|nr:hypothetical protein [Fimbriimonadaceae bacterium]
MTSRRNDLPNLSKYVAHTAQKSPEGQAAQTAGCMLSTIGAAVAWFALSRIIGILFGGLISVYQGIERARRIHRIRQRQY